METTTITTQDERQDVTCVCVSVCVFTQIDHQQASQCRVEGGPTPHVAQVGLVVHSQEGEVLALTQTHTGC